MAAAKGSQSVLLKGIYVQSYSQGSVSDLETAVRDSINGTVGADEMPDIFSSYADTAYEVEPQSFLLFKFISRITA